MPAAKTPRTKALPQPPHLAEPELTYVTERARSSWEHRVEDGFHETFGEDWTRLSRSLFPRAGCFGMRVGTDWMATASSAARMLSVPGGTELACAAVSDVTVAPSYRRRGLLRQMMRHQLESAVERALPMAALWASESSIYGRFGYGVATWSAHLAGQTRGTAFLPEIGLDGSVAQVDADQWLAAAKPIWEAVRTQQPGMFDREGDWWGLETWDPEKDRAGWSARRYIVHFDVAGLVDGVGSFRVKPSWSPSGPDSELKVGPVLATRPSAYAGLWRYQLDVDLARSFSSPDAAAHEPLQHLLADPRALDIRPVDGLYLRILDVVETLQTRTYSADADLVLQVSDPFLERVNGYYRVRITDGQAAVAPTDETPDLSLGARELAAAYLGGTSIADLHRAGRIAEHTQHAVRCASAAFGWHRTPHCPDHF